MNGCGVVDLEVVSDWTHPNTRDWLSPVQTKFQIWWRLYQPWWHHQMGTFSAFLAICAGNSPVSGEFPTQRPVTRSFDVFFDLCLNKRLSKQSWGWWFETLSCSLWRHCNGRHVMTRFWAQLALTHWGRVTHIYVSKLNIIGSDNGLLLGQRQAIIWTNAIILLIQSLGTNLSDILIEILIFSFMLMPWKMSSGKWWPFCLGLNVLSARPFSRSDDCIQFWNT